MPLELNDDTFNSKPFQVMIGEKDESGNGKNLLPILNLIPAFQPESFESRGNRQVSWLPWIYRPSHPDQSGQWHEVGKSLSRLLGMGLQLRGQLRIQTGFPFNPEQNLGSGTVFQAQTYT
jgi:hypothetical protein